MATYAILLSSIDPTLGRVDRDAFSDQILMEMFIGGLAEETKQRYQAADGTYPDVCNWAFVKCDADERVIAIMKYGRSTGSLQLAYIPSKLKELHMGLQKLTGSVDLTQLPESMETLNLNGNQLTGSIDLAHLPGRIREISLCRNRLTGSADLTHLPGSMTMLYLSHNQLSGSLCFDRLPAGMRFLILHYNAFTGPFIVVPLPASITHIKANRNQFSSTAVVDSRTNAFIKLSDSGVTLVIDENGNKSSAQVAFRN